MASSSVLLSQINEDYLTCQICMEPFEAPKVLSCQHSFCFKCLESCEKTAHGSYILCPLCRQRTVLGLKGVEGLKNNFVLTNIMEMLVEWRKTHLKDEATEGTEMCQTCPQNEAAMATYQCIECLDHLCADCAAFHSRTKLTKDHEVVPLQDIESGKYKAKIHNQEMTRCNLHQNLRLEKHCSDCDVLACRDCIVEDHQNHHLVPVDDAMRQVRMEVERIQTEMEQGVDSTRKSLEELLKLEEEERNQFAQVEQDIETLAEDFIAAIKERRTELLREIEEIQTSKFSTLTMAKEHLDMQLNCMINCTQLSNYVLQEGTLNEVVSLRKKMSETIEELKETARTSEKTYSSNLSHNHCIRFIAGNTQGNASRGMGLIETRKAAKPKTVKLDVFTVASSTPEKMSNHKLQINGKNLVYKPKAFARSSPSKEPCCSSHAKHTGITMTDEVLYVEIPEEINVSKPVPTPRKRKGNTEKLSLSVCPPRPPDPALKPNKPLLAVKPQVVEAKDHCSTTREGDTVHVPVKPITKVPPNHYPTTPSRGKRQPRPRSKLFSAESQLSLYPLTKDNDFDAQPDFDVKPTPCRAAPDPPTKPTLKPPMPESGNTGSSSKVKSNKKLPAPLPPCTLQTKLKAEILRVFGTKGQGYRDFQGPPTGVTMTGDKLLVLDGDGEQVIIFNSEGFYKNRFKVNIPNQGKFKPTGISISPSDQVYVLYTNLVTVWTMEGSLLTLFGHNELIDARGVAIDSRERVIVADQGRHEIIVFSKRGNKLLKFGSYGEGNNQFHCPRYVCTTTRDEIIVSDHHTHVVKMFDASGQFIAKCDTKANNLNYPESITTIWPKKGQAEILLIADEGNNKICAFDLQGKFLYHVLDRSSDPDLKSPQSIATCGEKKLVILQANSIQGRIYDLRNVTLQNQFDL